jgi:SAM-dependent methyltransferase
MTGTVDLSEFETLKAKLKDTWSAGDFGQIGGAHAKGNEEFVERLPIVQGVKLLDVACGTGTASIPAARAGAEVTGIDLAGNLVEQAIAYAKREGVSANFEVGDVEDLRFENNTFDLVITMFGAMFAPRPDITACELVRVTKSGGQIVMANWTPDSFIGQTFKLYTRYLPPPSGVPAPVLWGSKDIVGERFASGISDLGFELRRIFFEFPFGPEDVADHFKKYFGPAQNVFGSLDEAGQEAFRNELVDLWATHNVANDGSTRVESEYLEVKATKG